MEARKSFADIFTRHDERIRIGRNRVVIQCLHETRNAVTNGEYGMATDAGNIRSMHIQHASAGGALKDCQRRKWHVVVRRRTPVYVTRDPGFRAENPITPVSPKHICITFNGIKQPKRGA